MIISEYPNDGITRKRHFERCIYIFMTALSRGIPFEELLPHTAQKYRAATADRKRISKNLLKAVDTKTGSQPSGYSRLSETKLPKPDRDLNRRCGYQNDFISFSPSSSIHSEITIRSSCRDRTTDIPSLEGVTQIRVENYDSSHSKTMRLRSCETPSRPRFQLSRDRNPEFRTSSVLERGSFPLVNRLVRDGPAVTKMHVESIDV